MLYFYEIICLHAQNFISRDQKEASMLEGDLVVVQLYLDLYLSDLGK